MPPRPRRQGPFAITAALQERGVVVHISGLIATLPRSGSWLLAEGLSATRRVGQPAEFFRPDYLAAYRAAWGLDNDTPMEDYVRAALDRTASPTGVFTTKLHWYQFEWLSEALAIGDGRRFPPSLDRVRHVFPGLRVIYLTRRDRAKQALSYHVASVSQRWFQSDPARPKLTDDPDWAPDLQQVRFFEDALREHEARWEAVLTTSDVQVLRLSYEDLADDREGTVGDVLTFLGVADGSPSVLPPPALIRQAGSYTDMWAERYHAVRDELTPLTPAYRWSEKAAAYVER